MNTRQLFVTIFFCSLACTTQAQTQVLLAEQTVEPSAKIAQNWPASAEDMFKFSQIDFVSTSTRRRISLENKTYQVFGTRTSSLCISGVMPIEVSKVSDFKVEIHVPPKFNDDPNRYGMCQGYVFTFDLQNKALTSYQYYGNQNNRTGPYKYVGVKFE